MRNRGNPTAGDATWQFDHAGQGEPGNVRSDDDGLRTSDR